MHEVDFYDEITAEFQDVFQTNLSAENNAFKVYFTHNQICGNLKKGLDMLIEEHGLTCKALLKFAANAPTIKIDIFGIVVYGDYFRLLIAEIKYKSAVGLTEYSQLLGYCIAANANYGLLVNVDAGESEDLIKILKTQPSMTHIIRLLPDEQGRERHIKLAVMRWAHDSKTLTYSKLGVLPTIGRLCSDIVISLNFDFVEEAMGVEPPRINQ